MTTLKETTVDTASSIEAKMARMFGAHERILVLPVDHGMALGNVSGLDDPVGLVLDFLKVEGVNGVLASLPVGRRLSQAEWRRTGSAWSLWTARWVAAMGAYGR